MQEQKATMRIGSTHAKVLLEWFTFQEQNDIRIENSSIHMDEVNFSNKLKTINGKLKKHRKNSQITVNEAEAGMAYDWFENLPDILLDSKDAKMYIILKEFFEQNI